MALNFVLEYLYERFFVFGVSPDTNSLAKRKPHRSRKPPTGVHSAGGFLFHATCKNGWHVYYKQSVLIPQGTGSMQIQQCRGRCARKRCVFLDDQADITPALFLQMLLHQALQFRRVEMTVLYQ